MAANGKKLRADMKREPFRGDPELPGHLREIFADLDMEIGRQQQPDRIELLPGMKATT
jgi:hypothetical protein